MKNQKGITITSLILYIISFTLVIGIIGTITTFFNRNMEDISTSTGISSEYNKFNLYMLKLTKSGYEVSKRSNNYITFKKCIYDGNSEIVDTNTFVKLGNILYYNKIKLCENVNAFSVTEESAENGKEKINTSITIGDKEYTTSYIIEK